MDAIVANAALLSFVEIGLGSALHAFKVPLTGHFLSLNQGLLLSRASLSQRSKTLPAEVSNVSAVLKSLSPAGNRLTPMLAISAQGLCLTFGLTLFGLNPVGLSVGMLLLGLWPFFQPLAIAYLLFGETLVQAVTLVFRGIDKAFGTPVSLTLVFILVGVKCLLSLGVVVAAYRTPQTSFERYLGTIMRFRKKPGAISENARPRHPIWLALRDLCNPLFLGSLLLTLAFFLWAESPRATVVWGLIRPIAGGFLLFLLFRLLPLERIFGQDTTVRRALSTLREM